MQSHLLVFPFQLLGHFPEFKLPIKNSNINAPFSCLSGMGSQGLSGLEKGSGSCKCSQMCKALGSLLSA